jgi:hypothetical protein
MTNQNNTEQSSKKQDVDFRGVLTTCILPALSITVAGFAMMYCLALVLDWLPSISSFFTFEKEYFNLLIGLIYLVLFALVVSVCVRVTYETSSNVSWWIKAVVIFGGLYVLLVWRFFASFYALDDLSHFQVILATGMLIPIPVAMAFFDLHFFKSDTTER